MHDLLLKYFNEELSAEEKKELFATLKLNQESKDEFSAVQNVWALSLFAGQKEKDDFAYRKLREFNQRKKKKSVFQFLKRYTSYAAVFTVAVIATYILTTGTNTGEKEQPVSYEEFSTPAGQRARLKLHDGTVVWLNARSVLRYPSKFNTKERRVVLNGEAYFDVSENKKLPFVVETEKLDIKVLGTQFNVFAYHGRDDFNTSLLEGSVKVYTRGNEPQALTLKPNECALLRGDSLLKQTMSNKEFLLWKDGIYSFNDLPLSEIAGILELYYDVTIIIKNNQLKSFKYTGKFRQRDGVDNVLQKLQKVYPFTCHKDESTNTITLK